MCAPTTAALLLAALAALPCRGTFTETAPKILLLPKKVPKGTLFLNEDYQMLFTENPEHNQNNLETYHNNFTVRTNDNPALTANYSTLDDQIKSCCNNSNDVNINLSEGAVAENDDVGNKKRNRKKRVVKIQVEDRNRDSSPVGVTAVVAEVTFPPLVMERKRKPGETGSSAPLLNYIFDTYSNTHQHKNERSNPGNGIYAVASSEIEALVGSTAYLDCKVNALQDKFVSWVRRKNLEEAMELLTTGTQQYTSDDRYSARFIPPDIWRLEVRDVRPSDAAYYDCQLPAHPPRTARVTLRVPEVSVRIVDGAGADIAEQVCEVGSTVAMRCEVQGLKMEGGPSLLWYRKDYLLNDDTTRGGISVRTEFGSNGANSVLRVARVRGDDAGQYTCTVARAPPPAPPPAHVMLHIIKGESLAELHQGAAAEVSKIYLTFMIVVAMCAHIIVL